MLKFALVPLLPLVLMLQACSAPTDDAQAPAPDPQAQADLNPSTLDQPDTVSSLAAIIAHPRRAEDASRDQFRNPLPTLEFFDVQPDMQVAEIWPGWYTPILGPYLAETGQYTAVLFPDGISERIDARNAAFKERYDSEADFGTIAYGSFSGDAGLSLDDNSVDMILTFRNVHNWMGGGYAEAAFAEFYRALKPGGILGVVEHRLPETQTQDPKGSTGYVQESYMKALAADAGFEFVESSEVNANPLDTADHPFGVWTLPPRSRTPEEGSEEAEAFDADFYRNIGESDRATLKFRKPE